MRPSRRATIAALYEHRLCISNSMPSHSNIASAVSQPFFAHQALANRTAASVASLERRKPFCTRTWSSSIESVIRSANAR